MPNHIASCGSRAFFWFFLAENSLASTASVQMGVHGRAKVPDGALPRRRHVIGTDLQRERTMAKGYALRKVEL
jgi:hypothetical protein